MASLSLMLLPPGSAITPTPASHASSTASFQAVNRTCMLLAHIYTSTALVLLVNGIQNSSNTSTALLLFLSNYLVIGRNLLNQNILLKLHNCKCLLAPLIVNCGLKVHD
jgi:hypothetical protein